ncbi:MAG: 3-ketoacyl-ACP synthase, partial [Mycobacterium sp.]|nr:3-ketoacyl-ACP synthase [Mycobacterium sp.]
MHKVVITGRGIIAPMGNNVPDYLDALRNNVSGVGRISWPGESDTFWFAPVRDFEPTTWMSDKV